MIDLCCDRINKLQKSLAGQKSIAQAVRVKEREIAFLKQQEIENYFKPLSKFGLQTSILAPNPSLEASNNDATSNATINYWVFLHDKGVNFEKHPLLMFMLSIEQGSRVYNEYARKYILAIQKRENNYFLNRLNGCREKEKIKSMSDFSNIQVVNSAVISDVLERTIADHLSNKS